jgi:putative nucleotidyltransferase with HDIG domain
VILSSAPTHNSVAFKSDNANADTLEARRLWTFYQASTWFREMDRPEAIAQALVLFSAQLLDTARATIFVVDHTRADQHNTDQHNTEQHNTDQQGEASDPILKALFPIADLGMGVVKIRILSNQDCLTWHVMNQGVAARVDNDLLEPRIRFQEGTLEKPVSLLLIPIQTLDGEQLGLLRVSRGYPFTLEESVLLQAAVEAAAYVWIKAQHQWHQGILAKATTLGLQTYSPPELVHVFGDLILEVVAGNCTLGIWGNLEGHTEDQYQLLYTAKSIVQGKSKHPPPPPFINSNPWLSSELSSISHAVPHAPNAAKIRLEHDMTLELDDLLTTTQKLLTIDGFATLELNSEVPRYWLSWRMELCHTLCQMLSDLLKKALEDTLRIRRETALHALLRIKEQPQNHDSMLHTLLQLLAHTIRVNCVYLARVMDQEVEVLACHSDKLKPGTLFDFAGSTVEQIGKQMADQLQPIWLEQHTNPFSDPLPFPNVYLGLPLFNSHTRSTTFLVASSSHTFPPLERDFLSLMLEIFAVRLGSELRDAENNARLEATVQAHQILRSALTLQEVYQRTVDAAAEQSGHLNVILLLHQNDTDTLDLVACSVKNCHSTLDFKNVRGEGRLCWHVFESQTTFYAPDASSLSDPHYWSSNRARAAYLGVPLLDASGTVFGVLSMDSNLDRGDIRLQYRYYLEALAQAAGSAIGRLKALEEAEQAAARFQKLAELSIRLEALTDPQAISQTALETLIELTDFEAGSLMIQTRENVVRHLFLVGVHAPGYLENFVDCDFDIAKGMIGVSLQTREPMIQSDYPNWPEAIPGIGILSVALMPVFHCGTFYGILALRSFNKHVLDTPNARTVIEAITYRVERAIERSENLAQLRHTRTEALLAMGLMLEHRDLETKGHTERVTHIALEIGAALDLPEEQLEQLRWGAYLHDVGKVAIPDRVLLKTGKLDLEEWQVMQRHSILGEEMLQKLDFIPAPVLKVVRHHHERWDGSGYPEGLRQEQIPLLARVFSIADVFDALISERPYKRAWSREEAISEIRRQAGFQFDPQLVEIFLECNMVHAASDD